MSVLDQNPPDRWEKIGQRWYEIYRNHKGDKEVTGWFFVNETINNPNHSEPSPDEPIQNAFLSTTPIKYKSFCSAKGSLNHAINGK